MQPVPVGKTHKPYSTFYITADLVPPAQTAIFWRPTKQLVIGVQDGATRYDDDLASVSDLGLIFDGMVTA